MRFSPIPTPNNTTLDYECWFVGTVTHINIFSRPRVASFHPGSTGITLGLRSVSSDERDLLVDSLLYSAVNTRRMSLQDEFAYKYDDWLFALLQHAAVYPQVRIRRKKKRPIRRMIVFISSRTWWVGRRELGLRSGGQQSQAY